MVQTLKTKGNAALKKKLKEQAGFTLVELLIVVAIIAILAAVAIPAYSAQMENTRKAVDESALSSATSMAAADYLLNNRSGSVDYDVYQSSAGDARNVAAVADGDTAPTGFVKYVFQSKYTAMDITIGEGGVVEKSSIT